MAIDGIGASHAASAYAAAARQKTPAEEAPASTSGSVPWPVDSAEISDEAYRKLLEERAEKAFAGAPATFEEMEEGLAGKQREIVDIMDEAREVSGYDGAISQSPNGALYRVGPYAVFSHESGQWNWFNEDGTPRADRPPQAEYDEQLQVSTEKVRKHMAYLRENDIFEKFRELSRDATLLNMAGANGEFREAYLTDPAEAIRAGAETLLQGFDGYSYYQASGDEPGEFRQA